MSPNLLGKFTWSYVIQSRKITVKFEDNLSWAQREAAVSLPLESQPSQGWNVGSSFPGPSACQCVLGRDAELQAAHDSKRTLSLSALPALVCVNKGLNLSMHTQNIITCIAKTGSWLFLHCFVKYLSLGILVDEQIGGALVLGWKERSQQV